MVEIQSVVSKVFNQDFFFVILLGSADTDRFHIESDIDLAVYFKHPIEFKQLVQYQSLLSEKFDREVDLVDLNRIDPIFARQVLETGREVEIADRSFYNLWKAQQLSVYPDFKANRKVIEENLLTRKKYV